MTLEIDPHGSWRQNRFDFCNALEDALSKNDPKAWAELERLGVKRDERKDGK